MKQSFQLELPNGPFGDPLVVLRLRWMPRILLLDAGDTTVVGTRTLLETSDVLVSHAHVDHVFGLLRLLRIRLGRQDRPLRLFGPEGFSRRVASLLGGFTWNLVDAFPLDLSVVEVHEGHTETWRFPREQGFEPKLTGRGDGPEEGPVYRDDVLALDALRLDHGTIPSISWRVREHRSYHVDSRHLERLGLEPGPWLARLKAAFRGGEQESAVVRLPDGRAVPLAELRDSLIRVCEGDSLVYATDVGPDSGNLSRLAFFARGARRLVIETRFLESERSLAEEHGHLTAATAGGVARQAGVKAVCPLHFSPRYEADAEAVYAELKRAAGTVSIEDLPSGPRPSAG